MDFSKGNNLFADTSKVNLPESAQVVWVADMFVEDYVGGAELTSEALIESCPLEICKVHSKDVTMELLEEGHAKYWIFSNFSSMDVNLIPTVVANMAYSVIEYDYKFCKYRSQDLHKEAEQKECDCSNEMNGKMISALFCQARSLWWMSEKQMEIYHEKFPFLENKPNTVLSSVFSPQTLAKITLLREENKDTERTKWIILGSTSWIKGLAAAEKHCKENDLDYEIVWGLPYNTVLEKLAGAKGFVYLPVGGDTCPRMVIEAKILGCELVLNEFVQHKDEEWFNAISLPTDDPEDDDITKIEQYLYSCRETFWNGICSDMNWTPKISGYTTTKDCIKQKYPYEKTITSMLSFCDEVVIVDGGSTDGTWERLQVLAEGNEKIKIHQEARDWDHKRFAVFDGEQKAVARSLCTGDFCWQMDSDESVTAEDVPKIKDLVNQFPANVDLIALPVIEFWGSASKVRCDVQPWKWRLSRNKPHITHGIPAQLRQTDEDGNLYAMQGTDGCDYVHAETGAVIPCGNFYTQDVEQVRQRAVVGYKEGEMDFLESYEKWFNNLNDQLPSIFHYSWIDIERKIHTYKNYWSKHWCSLYDISLEDTAENNKFFDKAWSEVSDEEISDLAKKLGDEMGGWIFHNKINWDQKTKWISCKKEDC